MLSMLLCSDVNPLGRSTMKCLFTRTYSSSPLAPRVYRQSVTGGFLTGSFGELFWEIINFVSIVYALLQAPPMPPPTPPATPRFWALRVRAVSTSFLLTEHNLYVRDTINTWNAIWPNPSPRITPSWKEPRDKPGIGSRRIEETAWCVWFAKWDVSATPAPMVTICTQGD